MIRTIDQKSVEEALHAAYDRCKGETGGKNADYIPYLKTSRRRSSASPRHCPTVRS